MNPETHFYVLTDANNDVFYVGLTTQSPPRLRFLQHMREAKDGNASEKCERIRQCWDLGHAVGFEVVETIPPSEYDRRFDVEREWIDYYAASGYALSNIVSIPVPNDQTLAFAYQINTVVQQLPEYIELRKLISNYDYDIDPIDNLARMTESVIAQIAIFLEDGLDESFIVQMCKQYYWEYTDAEKEIRRIINEKVRTYHAEDTYGNYTD